MIGGGGEDTAGAVSRYNEGYLPAASSSSLSDGFSNGLTIDPSTAT